MGAWRYCEHCGAGQDQIALEEIEAVSYDEDAKVECEHCNKPRGDDTPALRFNLLLKEFLELRARIP